MITFIFQIRFNKAFQVPKHLFYIFHGIPLMRSVIATFNSSIVFGFFMKTLTNFSWFVASQVARYVPLDYFLGGYIKDRVFMKKLNTIDELKVAITDLINGIP